MSSYLHFEIATLFQRNKQLFLVQIHKSDQRQRRRRSQLSNQRFRTRIVLRRAMAVREGTELVLPCRSPFRAMPHRSLVQSAPFFCLLQRSYSEQKKDNGCQSCQHQKYPPGKPDRVIMDVINYGMKNIFNHRISKKYKYLIHEPLMIFINLLLMMDS